MRRKHHELLPQEGLDEPFGPRKPMDIAPLALFLPLSPCEQVLPLSTHGPSVGHCRETRVHTYRVLF
jgi:hypothetical protein